MRENEENIYNVIGLNIKKYRLKRKMTQQQLADTLMLSESFIAKLESKTFQTISIDTLEQIAHILNTDIMKFFDRNVTREYGKRSHR